MTRPLVVDRDAERAETAAHRLESWIVLAAEIVVLVWMLWRFGG